MDSLKIITCIFLCIGLLSCDLFKTRTPEEPDQQSGNFVPAIEPALVFYNLKNAVQDMNSEKYLDCLTDTLFSFEPTFRAKSNYPGTFDDWTKIEEGKYFNGIKSRLSQSGSVPKLEYLKLEPLGVPLDSVEYEVTYRLTIPHTKPAVPTIVSGDAQFILVVDKFQHWTIRRWVDVSSQSDSTWSELKGAFAQ